MGLNRLAAFEWDYFYFRRGQLKTDLGWIDNEFAPKHHLKPGPGIPESKAPLHRDSIFRTTIVRRISWTRSAQMTRQTELQLGRKAPPMQ